jgi:predicted  nucleic acid-binding Zn-ribbon protein
LQTELLDTKYYLSEGKAQVESLQIKLESTQAQKSKMDLELRESMRQMRDIEKQQKERSV